MVIVGVFGVALFNETAVGGDDLLQAAAGRAAGVAHVLLIQRRPLQGDGCT